MKLSDLTQPFGHVDLHGWIFDNFGVQLFQVLNSLVSQPGLHLTGIGANSWNMILIWANWNGHLVKFQEDSRVWSLVEQPHSKMLEAVWKFDCAVAWSVGVQEKVFFL